MYRLSTLASAVLLALNTPAWAERVSELELVDVWGTEVSASSVYLPDVDIELRQADHLSDLLREVPGVDVGGTHSLNQRINMRGLQEQDLDVRLDGASQQSKVFHHIGGLLLNPDILAAAEIQVGNNSVIYGGLGGAAYFTTKDGRDLLRAGESFGLRPYVQYADNAHQQASLTAYGQMAALDMLAYANWVARDNFDYGNGYQTFGAEGEVSNLLLKTGYQLNELNRLWLSLDYYRDQGDYSIRPDLSGYANTQLTKQQVVPTDYRRQTFTLGYQLDLGDALLLHSTLYHSGINLWRDEGQKATFRNQVVEGDNYNSGLNLLAQSHVSHGDLLLSPTYGFDYIKQRLSLNYPHHSEESTDTRAAFVELAFNYGGFTLTPGARYERFARDAVTGERNWDDLLFALAAQYQWHNGLRLFASSRELFKGPELAEMYTNTKLTTDTAADLRPESGVNSQAGVSWQLSDLSFAEQLVAGITFFDTRIDDYIEDVGIYTSGGRYPDRYLVSNVGDLELRGFEATLAYNLGMFNSLLSYSRANSDIQYYAGNSAYLERELGDAIGVSLDYQWLELGLKMHWFSQWVLQEDRVNGNTSAKPGYDVHNLYVQWRPWVAPRAVVSFGVDNLFDEHYASHASRSDLLRGSIDTTDFEPGRNIKLSLSYEF